MALEPVAESGRLNTQESVETVIEPALTDRTFWERYWADKEVQIEIGPRYLFHKFFPFSV